MKEPVIDKEGNSYEKSAITEWLQKNPVSPITRSPLFINDLRPNRGLKDAIAEWEKVSGTKTDKPEDEEKEESDVDVVDAKYGITYGEVDTNGDLPVHLSIISPEGDENTRAPCSVICVVDVSGSMQVEATLNTGKGVESHGLSQLDIVKHAVRTIINVLSPKDTLALVSYSTNASVVHDFLKMDKAGKTRAEAALSRLRASGQTNMWDALRVSLDLIKKAPMKGRNSAILLLTDGQPNISPPRGIIHAYQRFIKKAPECASTSVNTFGFGYNLDSVKLNTLAVQGNGMYCFIPDASFVGTIFVNALANIMTIHGKDARLTLTPLDSGVKILDTVGERIIEKKGEDGKMINIGTLQFDQSKDIVIMLHLDDTAISKPYLSAQLSYTNTHPHKTRMLAAKLLKNDGDDGTKNQTELAVQQIRLKLSALIKESVERGDSGLSNSTQAVKDLVAWIKTFDPKIQNDTRIVELLKDINGQVTEALSKSEYYTKWGRHYLPSLGRSHLLQVCNNFKDPGVQVYAGELFSDLRDDAEDVFTSLPAPKPSISHSQSSYQAPGAPRRSQVSSMRTYHSSSMPCFAGSGMVAMNSGEAKRVDNISKGDLLKNGNQVECVVRTVCGNGKADLVQVGNDQLLVTHWHPIRPLNSNAWEFPCQMENAEVQRGVDCEAVYSFVVEDRASMEINGMECITLGHGITNDSVAAHPYFGSNKVIRDLSNMNGWEAGLVELQPGCAVKDSETDMVCELVQ